MGPRLRPFGRARGQAAALFAAGLKDPDVAADCLISLAGADHDDPESRAGAYLVVEFFGSFRALLKGLSKPASKGGKRR